MGHEKQNMLSTLFICSRYDDTKPVENQQSFLKDMF